MQRLPVRICTQNPSLFTVKMDFLLFYLAFCNTFHRKSMSCSSTAQFHSKTGRHTVCSMFLFFFFFFSLAVASQLTCASVCTVQPQVNTSRVNLGLLMKSRHILLSSEGKELDSPHRFEVKDSFICV